MIKKSNVDKMNVGLQYWVENTILGGNELFGGGQRSPSAFLVYSVFIYFIVKMFQWI